MCRTETYKRLTLIDFTTLIEYETYHPNHPNHHQSPALVTLSFPFIQFGIIKFKHYKFHAELKQWLREGALRRAHHLELRLHNVHVRRQEPQGVHGLRAALLRGLH